MSDIKELTLQQIRAGLQEGQFSATELAESSLAAIERQEPKLHAFLEVTPELALRLAKNVDDKKARGEILPPLAGVSCGVKDSILVEGVPCTAGSRMLEGYLAPEDATVVAKLKKAGAILVGKTNLDEFSMGASTENSAFGPSRNPHDTEKVPGGSSGGSAVAVASGECVLSLGADTGGSIRQPAAFCGVVGLKPTYGSVSRYGLIALASSLDQIGPLARTVEDAEELFLAIAGKDERDATSVDFVAQNRDREGGLKGLRVGVPAEYFGEGLDKEVEQAVRSALERMEKNGAKLVEVHLPHTPYALAAYYVINMSEASANLARYDGLRYGKGKKGRTLEEGYLESRGEGLGEEVKRRIMLGTYALSAGYHDAYYLKAQKIRTLLSQDFAKAFEKADVLCGPVSPFLPFAFGERTKSPLEMYIVDVYTVPVNLAGLPAISLPVGMSGTGLPVGMQAIAPPFREDLLFSVGRAIENS
ncbi:MAG: Asp-tRNA(Asn)/Glu-tRNA(Gln) amidotransferase subunit GatA [Patescibacteria group bacterium]